jgi:hypothetical protein
MEVTTALRIETLKGRIDRSEYRVDVDKVAEAILVRPAARAWVLPVLASRQPPSYEDGAAPQTSAA